MVWELSLVGAMFVKTRSIAVGIGIGSFKVEDDFSVVFRNVYFLEDVSVYSLFYDFSFLNFLQAGSPTSFYFLVGPDFARTTVMEMLEDLRFADLLNPQISVLGIILLVGVVFRIYYFDHIFFFKGVSVFLKRMSSLDVYLTLYCLTFPQADCLWCITWLPRLFI